MRRSEKFEAARRIARKTKEKRVQQAIIDKREIGPSVSEGKVLKTLQIEEFDHGSD